MKLEWLVILLVGECYGGQDTEEALAHYIITRPTTDHPWSSKEQQIYKHIEDAIIDWNTAPETEEPIFDKKGVTRTPEPKAPRWWNQYMQEKYGDEPKYPNWSNETEVNEYLKRKKRRKWTPSQETFEAMKPDEEPFTWIPSLLKKDTESWTQPPWNSSEIERIGDEILIDRVKSDDSYDDTEYKEGPDSDYYNITEGSNESDHGTAATNKSAATLNRHLSAAELLEKGNKMNLLRQKQDGHVPAQFNHNRSKIKRMNSRVRKAALRAQLSPKDVKIDGRLQNKQLAVLQRHTKKKKDEALAKLWCLAKLRKQRNYIKAKKSEDLHQEYKKRKRRPIAVAGVQRLH